VLLSYLLTCPDYFSPQIIQSNRTCGLWSWCVYFSSSCYVLFLLRCIKCDKISPSIGKLIKMWYNVVSHNHLINSFMFG